VGCQWLAREESGGERTKTRCFSRSRNMVVFCLSFLFVAQFVLTLDWVRWVGAFDMYAGKACGKKQDTS